MKINEQSNLNRTFFIFGLTVYLIGFLSLIHFYRVRKVAFREDFGHNFAWSEKGVDFKYLHSLSSGIVKGEYAFSVHPPWAAVSYIPLTFLKPEFAYLFFTYILLLLLFFTIFLCVRENKVFDSVQMTLFVALMSTVFYYHTYPVLFSIERGQFTIIIGFFAMKNRST